MHFAISASWGPTDPTRAMLPFIFAASALQVKDTVTIMLFHDAVHLALKGFAEKVIPIGPPSRFEEVINDDDMLDGWFIIQRKKSESERAKSELEERTQNDKIMNSDEVYVFTDSRKEADAIEGMNSVNSSMIKKERLQTIKGKGSAQDQDFRDQKIRISNMQHQQFKENFRR